ncbi:MAG: TlpA family protein disulfide reductase [Thermoleophilum sp.]|nr:TlpA family protein disulfide reductase [Thermoleophilum sp.]
MPDPSRETEPSEATAVVAARAEPDAEPASPSPRLGVRVASALVAGAFIALLVYGLLSRPGGGTIDSRLARGETPTAPRFALPLLVTGDRQALAPRLQRALADGRLGLGELRGTPVVLNFWASWCPPCRSEAPTLERVWRRERRSGVLFLGLNMQDVRDDARAFVRDFGLTYPSVREPDNETARRYGVTGLPETFFIDARGRVVGHVIGEVTGEQLASGVAAARRGIALGRRSGGDRRTTR